MTHTSDLPTLIATVRSKLASSDSTLVITISGPSGSGKTHFVKALQREFPDSLVVGTDNYYIGKTRMKKEMPAGQELNFDHPEAIDTERLAEDIRQLQAGDAIDMPHYDMLISEPLPQTTHLLPKPLIIVEGLVANCPTLRNLSNLSIRVTAPFEVRLTRRIERDKTRKNHTPEETKEYMLNIVEPAYERYFQTNDTGVDFSISSNTL